MAPGARLGIRTPNLLIRSEMLYPIELSMHYFPRMQGLVTTLERGANIAIIVAISNDLWKFPFKSEPKNPSNNTQFVLNCDTVYEKIYRRCSGYRLCHRPCPQ